MGQILDRIKTIGKAYYNSSKANLEVDEILETYDDKLKNEIDNLSKKSNNNVNSKQGKQNQQQEAKSNFTQNVNPKEHSALKVLGLATDVGNEQIKKRFLELMKKYHPDRASSANKEDFEIKTKEINVAFTTLKQMRNF